MEWWNSGYTFMTILALFSAALVYGKTQYEINPEYFEHKDCFKGDIKNWKTWKPNKTPSIHSRMTNAIHRCRKNINEKKK